MTSYLGEPVTVSRNVSYSSVEVFYANKLDSYVYVIMDILVFSRVSLFFSFNF